MADRLGRNFVFLAASNVLAPLFSMVLVLAISRLRGVEELGKYSLVMTWFVVGQTIAGFGLPVIVTREVAQDRRRAGQYFLAASAVSFALLVPVLALAVPALQAWQEDVGLRTALLLMLVVLVPSGVTQAAEAVLLAFERAPDFVLVNMSETILRAIVGCVLVMSGEGVPQIAMAIVVLRALAAAAYIVVLRWRGVSFAGGIDRRTLQSLAHEVPVVGAIPVVNSVYARADMFLLSALGTWTEVGLYGAALRLVDLARTIAPAYARALYPVLARLHGEGDEGFAAMGRRGLRTNVLLAVPVVLAYFALADPIVALLFGPALAPAAAVLRTLAWSLLPLSVAVTLAQMLFATGHQAVDLRVNVISTIVSVAANAVLIPRLGGVGAAIAVVGTTSLYAALQYLWVTRYVIGIDLGAYLARLGAVVAAAALTSVGARSHPVLGALAAGGVAVGGFLVARVVTSVEVRDAWAGLTRWRGGLQRKRLLTF